MGAGKEDRHAGTCQIDLHDMSIQDEVEAATITAGLDAHDHIFGQVSKGRIEGFQRIHAIDLQGGDLLAGKLGQQCLRVWRSYGPFAHR